LGEHVLHIGSLKHSMTVRIWNKTFKSSAVIWFVVLVFPLERHFKMQLLAYR
jgi:hypothetical protein